MRLEMQQQIDDLKRLLEEEKMKMGAAGKAREEELLSEIANLRKQLGDRAARIDELKETLADKENIIVQRDATIEELQNQIRELESQILVLKEQLTQAQASGDQVLQDLRDKLKKLTEEFDMFKAKAAKDFESMQT